MRTAARCFCISVLLVSAGWGCGFQYDPASLPHYYRAEGWRLPGLSDVNRSAKWDAFGSPAPAEVPGGLFYPVLHDDPYIVSFPAEWFELAGSRKRMRELVAKAKILRVVIDGKTVAYTYGLIPVFSAHKDSKGKWVWKTEAGCIFTATFVDDRGDGIFRVLIPGALTPDSVPAWVRRPQT